MRNACWVILLWIFMVAIPAFAGDSGVRFSAISGQVDVRPDADLKGWKL